MSQSTNEPTSVILSDKEPASVSKPNKEPEPASISKPVSEPTSKSQPVEKSASASEPVDEPTSEPKSEPISASEPTVESSTVGDPFSGSKEAWIHSAQQVWEATGSPDWVPPSERKHKFYRRPSWLPVTTGDSENEIVDLPGIKLIKKTTSKPEDTPKSSSDADS